MISIATTDYDVLGWITTKGVFAVDFSRRYQSYKTLDGGVVVDDRGFNYGDTPIRITLYPSEAEMDRLIYMAQNYSEHRLCVDSSVYKGLLASLVDNQDGSASITFQVSETEKS